MGKRDNRLSPKMRRRKSHRKLKERIRRRREEGRKAKVATKPAPAAPRAKKSREP
jgi:hypothetical protein